MKVSVVVLNWLDPRLAEICLRSAASALTGLAFELIVVENGSREHVRMDPGIGRLKHLVLDDNVGVARGRNAGIAAAAGQYILVLDDDARVLADLRPLVTFMDQRTSVGVVGPLIVDSRGRTMFTCRRFPTLVDKVSRRLPPGWGWRVLNESELRDWDHGKPALVDYVIGAAQLMRTEAVFQVGPYDSTYFYGPEDVDLCLRMWRHNWEVAYFPGALVRHDERRMTTRLSRLTLRHYAALARFYLRHRYLLSRRNLYRQLPGRRRAQHMELIRGELECNL